MKFAKISSSSSCCIIIIIHFAVLAEPFSYLGILPSGITSHFIFGSALVKALAEKGHEVYVISAFPQRQTIKNYHDVPFEPTKIYVQDIFDENKEVNFNNTNIDMSETVLRTPSVQKLMASSLKFDAVICELVFSEALFGFSEHFNAPLIVLGSHGAVGRNTEMIGSPSFSSHVPHTMLSFSNCMSFTERIINLGYFTLEYLSLYYLELPGQVALYKKYFPHLKRDLYTVRRNAAAVLLNTHVTLTFPRPYVPNQIEVGGMHIKDKRNPLPPRLEKFIKEAKYGVVYFSLGSTLQSRSLPVTTKEELFNAFKRLKQRVLWKYEHKYLQGEYENIFISAWFPQEDVLAHENVKVFITHGGLLSITESIYYGKPIIGIPLFGDQFANMARVVYHGVGVSLQLNSLKAKKLVSTVDLVMGSKRYARNIKAMSRRYRDQAVKPLNLAVYWAEHVVRQKGAKYLHCAGLDLSLVEYYNIDIIFTIVIGLVLIYVIYYKYSRH